MQKLKAVNLDYDTRMTEWNLKHEVISQADLNVYLKGLSDDASNSTPLTIDEEVAASTATISNDDVSDDSASDETESEDMESEDEEADEDTDDEDAEADDTDAELES